MLFPRGPLSVTMGMDLGAKRFASEDRGGRQAVRGSAYSAARDGDETPYNWPGFAATEVKGCNTCPA
jgi:hypothetical protein